jgi:hypothetical protein
VVRLVFGACGTPREATTAAGQPTRAPSQPRQLQHEQRRESEYAEDEVKLEEEEGGQEVARRERPNPPQTVRFVPVALAAPREAATAQSQSRAPRPRQLLQHEQKHGSSYNEEVEVREEECSDEDAEAEEVEAMRQERRRREQRARAPGASSVGREEAGADVLAPASQRVLTSQFNGVHWNKGRGKWQVKCKGKYLGLHATEEAAARAYNNYGKDSVDTVQRNSSQFRGVSWEKRRGKWKAECKKKSLGYHPTEEAAARAYHNYVEDGVEPVQHRGVLTFQFMGVYWNKRRGKWVGEYEGKSLGRHATEEAAARAVEKYAKDGVDLVKHQAVRSSQFKGVSWEKRSSKWKAECKGKYLGYHAKEEAAARAYNKEAERIGRVDLNVVPPAGDADDSSNTNAAAAAAASLTVASPAAPARAHAGAGSKRAAPTTPAPPQATMSRLDTSAAVVDARDTAAAAAHSAALKARINDVVEEEESYEEAEEAEAGEDDDEAEGKREQHAQSLGASHDKRLEAGPGAAGGSKRAALAPPPEPHQAKMTRQDTSAVAAGPRAATTPAPANAAAQEAAWEARVKAEKAKTEVAEARTEVAEANTKVAEAQAAIEEAQAAAEKAKAALAEKQLAAHVAEQAAAESERMAARAA